MRTGVPERPLQIEHADLSLLGHREENQDRVAIADGDGSVLLAVVDGMGGHADGARAAEEAIRTLVEFTLTHLGYKVCSAATALEGVELYRQKLQAGERFDCVILDLTLPGGMGGRDALKLLLEIDPSVNAIVSSGYAMDATMSHYQDFGFRGVITKPYEAAELGRTVREVIESGRIKLVPDLDLQAVG